MPRRRAAGTNRSATTLKGVRSMLHQRERAQGRPGARLNEGAVEALRRQLKGEIVRPGEAGYDQARVVWNGMIDRRPSLIARCTGAVDVIAAVNFARSHDLLVAVRGGGHSVAGLATC